MMTDDSDECTLYTGINIDSHSRFCWQNQNHIDLEFSIVINMPARARARNVLLSRARARERAKYKLAFILDQRTFTSMSTKVKWLGI